MSLVSARMSTARTARPQTASLPEVPLTIEGYSVLHQMMKVRWPAWRLLSDAQKREIVDEASAVLSKMEQNQNAQSLHLLLSHGSPPRRGQELVHVTHRRTPAADARARARRPPLRRGGEADHLRFHWLR